MAEEEQRKRRVTEEANSSATFVHIIIFPLSVTSSAVL